MKINSISGEYDFLRNDFECNVLFDGEVYSSVEHAFQAAKVSDLEKRKEIRDASSIKEMRKIGRSVKLPDNWVNDRIEVMKKLLQSKFNDNLALKFQLALTGDSDLVQGGMTNGDRFWGVDEFGVGENKLGQLLMEVRQEIADSVDAGCLNEVAPEMLKGLIEDQCVGFLLDHIKWVQKDGTEISLNA